MMEHGGQALGLKMRSLEAVTKLVHPMVLQVLFPLIEPRDLETCRKCGSATARNTRITQDGQLAHRFSEARRADLKEESRRPSEQLACRRQRILHAVSEAPALS